MSGLPQPFHATHDGARALGGAGLIITEMSCVSADARITLGCTGIWNETLRQAWAANVDRRGQPVYGRMFLAPFSDRICNEARVPTIAVGNIFEADHLNTIIAAGRADLCALAGPHLADPAWTLHAAAAQGYTAIEWPQPYLGGKQQFERNLECAAQVALNA